MKIGLLRQNTLITCPSAMGERSTSMGAPAAMVEASGFICATSGHSAPMTPTAAAAPVAMKRKSRRVGSVADSVADIMVTCASPRLSLASPAAERLQQLASWDANLSCAPRHGDAAWRRRATLPLFPPRLKSGGERRGGPYIGVVLAPLPGERKWAGAAPADTTQAFCPS